MTAENRKLKLFSTRSQLSFFQQTNVWYCFVLRKTRVQTDQNSFERSIKTLVSKNHIVLLHITYTDTYTC